MDRAFRYLSGRKQNKIRVVNSQPSLQSMRDGQELLYFNKNGQLSRYRKERGQLFRSDMTHTGDQFVDKKLLASKLEYKKMFVDYRIYKHNYADNIATTEHFLPWQGTGEKTDMNEATSTLLVPFKMTCHKILFRPETFSESSVDFTFKVKRQDSGDTTVDEVASVTKTVTEDDTTIQIIQTDFNNTPIVDVGAKVSISIQADVNPHSSSKDYYITSVWRTEIQI